MTTRSSSRTTAPKATEVGRRQTAASGVASLEAKADLQAVTATWCFDSGERGPPYSATIRFSGHRIDVEGKPDRRDRFERDETVHGIVPGSGLVAVTTQVDGVNPGNWSVTASMVRAGPAASHRRSARASRRHRFRLHPATWSWWRWRLAPGRAAPVETRWAPLAPLLNRPAVVPGGWLALVVAGVVVGLILQRRVLAGEQLPTDRALAVSLAAILVGFVGARLWYLVLQRRSRRRTSFGAGWCIQGFLIGLAVTLLVALPLADLPVGRFFDASTPGLFVGLAVGRLGCFFTGCCGGRMTASRWGVWCSDRRVCARRVPTQLFESLTAASVGLTALVLIGRYNIAVPGALFVGAFAGYTLIRQFLLQLRSEPRKSALGWRITAAVAAAVLVGDALIVAVSTV